jgi:hypothetical protein
VEDLVGRPSGDRGEVGDAIRLERKKIRQAVASHDTSSGFGHQLARIAPDLVAAVYQLTDQLQPRRPQHLPKREYSRVPGSAGATRYLLLENIIQTPAQLCMKAAVARAALFAAICL